MPVTGGWRGILRDMEQATVKIPMLMSRELIEQLSAGWSQPVQLKIVQETDGFWSLLARTPEVGEQRERR